jgi:hypothetical protein
MGVHYTSIFDLFIFCRVRKASKNGMDAVSFDLIMAIATNYLPYHTAVLKHPIIGHGYASNSATTTAAVINGKWYCTYGQTLLEWPLCNTLIIIPILYLLIHVCKGPDWAIHYIHVTMLAIGLQSPQRSRELQVNEVKIMPIKTIKDMMLCKLARVG